MVLSRFAKSVKQVKKLNFTKNQYVHNLGVNLKDLSYMHGTSSQPLIYQSIGQLLYEKANQFPENTAVISHEQNVSFNYAELLTKAEQVAASLKKLGLQKHDRIGIYSPNNYEWLLVQLAASLSDLILVNINPAYQTHELEYCLNKVNIKCLITADKYRKSNYIEMISEIIPELQNNPKPGEINAAKVKDLKYLIRIDDVKTLGYLNFKDLFEMSDSKHIQLIRDMNVNIIDPDQPTNIQFTSGTTGAPKGATLSHLNVVNNGLFIGERMRITNQDKICIPVPLYHCFGMVLGNMTALTRGATMVYPSAVFQPIPTLESVTQYNCTALYGVPTMFIEYFKEYEANKQKYDISSLRTGIMAGTLCPAVLMEKVVNDFGMNEITICYGMTETSPVSFQTLPDDNFHNRTQTVGTIYPHVEVKIVNPDGQVVKRNEKGELWVRGYNVMKGYFNDVEQTEKTIDQDNWLHTGDICVLDDNGYLRVTGRIKDMIIRGGENIYPREIEDFLLTMPGVEAAQVVGVYDEKYGEETFAQIKLKPDVKKEDFNIKDVYDFCRGTIAHYKVPKYVQIVDSYPLTISGKVQKFKIVEELEKQRDQFEQYKIRHY